VTAQPLQIGVRELRRDLGAYLRRAAAGESITVTSRDKAIAQLGPPPQMPGPRKGGTLKGRIWMADDFDELPPEILDLMTGPL
jgi:antitoxin (DNA-binding transcriptional repressor) of toxin-antitoxin stability system